MLVTLSSFTKSSVRRVLICSRSPMSSPNTNTIHFGEAFGDQEMCGVMKQNKADSQ